MSRVRISERPLTHLPASERARAAVQVQEPDPQHPTPLDRQMESDGERLGRELGEVSLTPAQRARRQARETTEAPTVQLPRTTRVAAPSDLSEAAELGRELGLSYLSPSQRERAEVRRR